MLRTALLAATLCLLAIWIYLPGLDGPYIYDDYSNLLDNRYLRVEALSYESLLRAAFSMHSGVLQRPVAMASFALNSYFAGGFASAVPFRVVNVAIHVINAVLVCLILRLLIERYRASFARREEANVISSDLLAAACALVWAAHPINLTSVLYVVQRMTSLAALFTLVALLAYLLGRSRLAIGQTRNGWIIFGCGVVAWSFGVLSKETALLLPIFIVGLELILFRQWAPWKAWCQLSPCARTLAGSAVVGLFIVALLAAIQYASNDYAHRNFTMYERVLTESRVLVTYLGLIVFPRLDALGMFHDDIAISHSLLDPPTTAIAIVILVSLVAIAAISARRAPLVALGIVWFFVGHLLESTIFALEIAHEHRNYLPSLGLPFVLVGLVYSPLKLSEKSWVLVLTAIGLCFGALTYLRSSQWTDEITFYSTEARHHPNSADANAGLGAALIALGRTAEGMEALRHAAAVKPEEAAPLINLATFLALRELPAAREDLDAIDHRLATFATNATTQRALQFAADCAGTSCRSVAPYLEHWLRIMLDENRRSAIYDRPSTYRLLGQALTAGGKLDDAIDAFRTAYALDPEYLIPLFDIAKIYLAAGRLDYARVIAMEIRRANERVALPRRDELRQLEMLLNQPSSSRK